MDGGDMKPILTPIARRCSAGARRLAIVCLLVFAGFSVEQATAQESADQVLTEPDAAAAPDTAESLLPTNSTWLGDFDGMRERRRVRFLVPFSKTFYFIDKGGEQFGLTYEFGKTFEGWLNKKYKTKSLPIEVVFVPVSRDRMLTGLV